MERTGRVGVVTFHGSDERGIIDGAAAAVLGDAIAALLNDGAIGAVVLCGGREGVFIRHADVAQIAEFAAALRSGERTVDAVGRSPFETLCRLIENADRPVIAAIDGTCMGGGLEIALACTLRMCSQHVEAIGLPEIRLGIFPGAGGTWRLPRVVGESTARLLMLTGSTLTGAEAFRIGLVDRLCPDVRSAAIDMARAIAGRSPGAVKEIMRWSRRGADPSAAAGAFGLFLRDDIEAASRLEEFIASGIALESMP